MAKVGWRLRHKSNFTFLLKNNILLNIMDSVGHISFAADQQRDLEEVTRFTKTSCSL